MCTWKLYKKYSVNNAPDLCLLDIIEEETAEILGVCVVFENDIHGKDFKNAKYWDIENENLAYEYIKTTQNFYINYSY